MNAPWSPPQHPRDECGRYERPRSEAERRHALWTPGDYALAAQNASRWVDRVGEVRGGDGRVVVPVRGRFGITPEWWRRQIARRLQERAPIGTEVLVERLP